MPEDTPRYKNANMATMIFFTTAQRYFHLQLPDMIVLIKYFFNR